MSQTVDRGSLGALYSSSADVSDPVYSGREEPSGGSSQQPAEGNMWTDETVCRLPSLQHHRGDAERNL